MDEETFFSLIERKPGYETLYLLLQSPRRRSEISDYSNCEGGTFDNWLTDAEAAGLISIEESLRDNERYLEVSLDCKIPKTVARVIVQRGRHGSRKNYADHQDYANTRIWTDDISLDHIQNTLEWKESFEDK